MCRTVLPRLCKGLLGSEYRNAPWSGHRWPRHYAMKVYTCVIPPLPAQACKRSGEQPKMGAPGLTRPESSATTISAH
eukprot:11674844-Alexandrium_andersonii.AAC.1